MLVRVVMFPLPFKSFGADATWAWLPTVPPVSDSQAPGATAGMAPSGSGGGGGIDKPGGPEDKKLSISLPKDPGSSKSK